MPNMPNRLLQNKKNTNKWKMTESACNVPIENTYPWCRRLLVSLAVCRPEHLESLGSLIDKAKLTLTKIKTIYELYGHYAP